MPRTLITKIPLKIVEKHTLLADDRRLSYMLYEPAKAIGPESWPSHIGKGIVPTIQSILNLYYMHFLIIPSSKIH